MLYCEKEDYKLYNDDMLDINNFISNNSVATIITDPPYEINFMGKGWDNTGIAYQVETWKKCFNTLKDGGYLLVFGATRTFHRVACAIEDAGFEIRDTMMWLYGSGFPKSHDIGLQIDKKQGCSDRGHRIAVANRYHPDGTYEPNGDNLPPYEARTELGKKWVGWGTCLKPAYEPIIVARKPFKTTLVDNVLSNGVGGINIDECRVGNEEISIHNAPIGTFAGGEYNRGSDTNTYRSSIGRFPSNLITDGSEEIAMGMPNKDDISAMRFFYCAKASKKDRDEGLDSFESKKVKITNQYDMKRDDGTIREETCKKNFHPTVKPTKLMQYLVRMFTPKGETILDCFMGSGSTGKAVMFENRERNADYKFIGVEKNEDYMPICKARIDYALNYKYDLPENKKVEENKGQLSLSL